MCLRTFRSSYFLNFLLVLGILLVPASIAAQSPFSAELSVDKVVIFAWSPDSSKIALLRQDGLAAYLEVWDVNTRRKLTELTALEHPIMDAEFPLNKYLLQWSASGRYLAALLSSDEGENTSLSIWDVSDFSLIYTAQDVPYNALSFSPKNILTEHLLALSEYSGQLTLLNPDAGMLLQPMWSGITNVEYVEWSANGQYLVAVSRRQINSVNFETGSISHRYALYNDGVPAVFWRDGNLIAVDASACLFQWGGTSMESLINVDGRFCQYGLMGRIIDYRSLKTDVIAVVPQQLDIQSNDFSKSVWIITETFTPVAQLMLESRVVNVRWSPEGNQLGTLTLDGTLRIWKYLDTQ